VIKPGVHGLTTAFEFLDETRNRVNVMLHDAGDNADFGPDRINSNQELTILQKAQQQNPTGLVISNMRSRPLLIALA